MSDVTFDLRNNGMEVHHRKSEPWRVTLVDTGEATLTGGRLKRVAAYVREEESFCFTYGDGVSDVDINALIRFHRHHGKAATLTAVCPPGRYGAIKREGDQVTAFSEKPAGDGGRINGGFFVLNPSVLDLLEGDRTSWEVGPLDKLAEQGQLMAYPHDGFWLPMDTLRDKNNLEDLWVRGKAPWKKW
jgi:glucose-1-phosphate cytidylyltransferase